MGPVTVEPEPYGGGHMPSRGWHIDMKTWAEFLGLYLAEGWTREPFEAFVSQSPESPRLAEVQRILDATPFKWSYDPKKCQFSTTSKTLVTELSRCGKYAHNKFIPVEMKELATPYLKALLHGHWVGDGTTIKSTGQRSFATTSTKLADDIQELLIKCGRMASRRTQGTSHPERRPYYTLMESHLPYRVLPKPKMVPYSGQVWCASVPNETLYTRRNGVVTLSSNSIPGTFVIAGDQYVTPAQQRQLQDTLNAIAGDVAWKHRVIVLPPGSKTDPQKNMDGQYQMDSMVAEQVAMILHIQPHEIGMVPGGRSSSLGGGGKGQAEQQAASATESRTMPDAKWWKETCFDWLIQNVFGQDDLEWKWLDFEEAEDDATRSQTEQAAISMGKSSIDEIRVEAGEDPWNFPLTQSPFLIVPGVGMVPLNPTVAPPAPPTPPVAPGGGAGVPAGPAGAALANALQPAPGKDPEKPKNNPAVALMSGKKKDRKKARAEIQDRFEGNLKHATKKDPQKQPQPLPPAAIAPQTAPQPATATQPPGTPQAGAPAPAQQNQPAAQPPAQAPALAPSQRPTKKLSVADLIKKKSDLSQDEFVQVVQADLSHQYPSNLTSWVPRLTWSYDDGVKVKDMTGQPGSGKSHEIIDALGLAMQAGAPVDPLVLVEFSDALVVANGNKRLMAAQEQDVKKLPAYIGTVAPADADAVHAAIKAMQDPQYQPAAAKAELATLRRFLRKGGDVAKFTTTAIDPDVMKALIADLTTMDRDAALDKARDLISHGSKSISIGAPLSTGVVPFDLAGQAPTKCPQCGLTLDEDGLCPSHGTAVSKRQAADNMLAAVEAELLKRGVNPLTLGDDDATLTKYSADQPRDADGKFGSGGASADPLVETVRDSETP